MDIRLQENCILVAWAKNHKERRIEEWKTFKNKNNWQKKRKREIDRRENSLECSILKIVSSEAENINLVLWDNKKLQK